MALNMSKKDVEQLNALKKKQKAVSKQKAQFKKMIIENQDFVRQVLKENEAQERHFVGMQAQAVSCIIKIPIIAEHCLVFP